MKFMMLLAVSSKVFNGAKFKECFYGCVYHITKIPKKHHDLIHEQEKERIKRAGALLHPPEGALDNEAFDGFLVGQETRADTNRRPTKMSVG
jgi:hypothetical protein